MRTASGGPGQQAWRRRRRRHSAAHPAAEGGSVSAASGGEGGLDEGKQPLPHVWVAGVTQEVLCASRWQGSWVRNEIICVRKK